VDGVVAQRSVQLGQQVAPGAPLMAVVPLRKVWVDANFRETQLADLRIGQRPPSMPTPMARGDLPRQGDRPVGGFGQRLCPAARAECQRQLDQDRPARAGAHRA
jgi:multidrug efflux pump subunit AcrA (membrane-fusion protein)